MNILRSYYLVGCKKKERSTLFLLRPLFLKNYCASILKKSKQRHWQVYTNLHPMSSQKTGPNPYNFYNFSLAQRQRNHYRHANEKKNLNSPPRSGLNENKLLNHYVGSSYKRFGGINPHHFVDRAGWSCYDFQSLKSKE